MLRGLPSSSRVHRFRLCEWSEPPRRHTRACTGAFGFGTVCWTFSDHQLYPRRIGKNHKSRFTTALKPFHSDLTQKCSLGFKGLYRGDACNCKQPATASITPVQFFYLYISPCKKHSTVGVCLQTLCPSATRNHSEERQNEELLM